MANHYLQFSEAVGQLTAAERDWLRRELEFVYVFGDRLGGEQYTEAELPSNLSISTARWCGYRTFVDLADDLSESDEELGFEYKFLEDSQELGSYLWLYAEEGGQPERVGHLIQKFLRQFRPSDSWSLTYATTCSKPRLGEFAGGAVFVTADAIESFDAYDFVRTQHTAHSARTRAGQQP